MTDTITIPASSVAELASIGQALTRFAEKLSSGQINSQSHSVLNDEAFLLEAEKLSENFSDLSEQDLNNLITEAVQAARSTTA